jgi:hypothetical protein
MAETCKGMMERPFSGMVMRVPGIVFIALGVLIVIWPSVLAWLVAAGCIPMGIAMLMMAKFMRGIAARISES